MVLVQLEVIKMKHQLNNLFLILLLILLAGCPGSTDSMNSVKLSGDYIYHEPGGLPFIEKENSNKGIPGWIFSYDYNSHFIVALEKDINISNDKKDELILNGDFYDFVNKNGNSKYWIIVIHNDSIYGPYSKVEYLQMREKIGVPKTLQLKNE